MKVLKFGASTISSAESVLLLRQIVEDEGKERPVIVVVSALDGVTDQLLRVSRLAQHGDNDWEAEFNAMVARHSEIIKAVVADAGKRDELSGVMGTLFEQLRSICFGVYLIHDLSARTRDVIVSYGERLSSNIVARLLPDAALFDARDFIKTEFNDGKHLLDSELTSKLISVKFMNAPRLSVVPGFISRDKDTDEVTNLGRGGSDYTAAIIAATLEAEELDIWTDVDGFTTADPRIIKSAYTIIELSYTEAMELCNFGAKVIYPPTIYPVCVKHIPMRIRNMFNLDNLGTVVKDGTSDTSKPIRGLSSISGTTIITVSGLSMVGVRGVNRRIFTTLADNGISVFMVAQTSSENSTSIGVRDEDSEEATRVLNNEYAKEIETGTMFPMQSKSGLATIAIVGENMKDTPGLAGKFFGVLGRSGINVIACAQGALETNISVVVDSKDLRKSLNVIHDSFFLSEYKVLNLFICGVGTVGGKLIEQIKEQYEELKRRSQLKLNVVGVASSRNAIFNREGISLDTFREELRSSATSSPVQLQDNILKMNIFNSVFVDCTASSEIADLYQSFLAHNISVIAANKIAASSAYGDYVKLKRTALERCVKFRFETNVGAGLPLIGTINDLRNSGDRVLKIEAVLSGTLNFIFNKISADVPFSEAVRQAKEQGFSEPDPRIDLSGIDVVRKLVILTREAGYKIEQDDVLKDVLIPNEFFDGTVDEFWRRLPELDVYFEEKRREVATKGKHLRFVATMELGNATVGLRTIAHGHPFYNLEGSNNIVSLTTERYKEYPMLIQGYGAGASVTAAGVFANIISVANI